MAHPLGLMTEAGQATLPDPAARHTVGAEIVAALQAEPDAVAISGVSRFYRRARTGISRRRAGSGRV